MADEGNQRKMARWLVSAATLLALAMPVISPVQAAPAAASVDGKRAQSAKAKPKARAKSRVVREAAKDSESAVERLRPGTLGSFTPSILDPNRASTLALPGRGPLRAQTSERSFRFTPSGKVGDRKSVTLGITSRVLTTSDPVRTAADEGTTPSGYNVGVSVGYKGFSLSGGYSKLDTGLSPLLPRESVDVGLSYGGKSWKTSLQVGAEEGADLLPDSLGLERRYSVEFGGAYALTPRLSLSGGVRYRIDSLDNMPTRFDSDRSDSAVYLGTALSF